MYLGIEELEVQMMKVAIVAPTHNTFHRKSSSMEIFSSYIEQLKILCMLRDDRLLYLHLAIPKSGI